MSLSLPRIWQRLVTSVFDNPGQKKALWSQVLFSLYVAGGFCLISWQTTYYDSRAFQQLVGDRGLPEAQLLWRQYLSPSIPPYPLGHYIQLLAVAVFVLTLLEPRVLRLLGRDNTSARLAYLCLSFLLITLICAAINFGLGSPYVWSALCCSVVFGLIGGIRRLRIDYSYLGRHDLPEDTKVAMLRAEADKWLTGLSLFTMILVAVAISAALFLVVMVPEDLGIRQFTLTPALWAEAYLALGIGLGVYWSIIKKVNETLKKITDVRKEESTKPLQSP